MATIKISGMQNVSEHNGVEYGQVIQDGNNRKAVLLFADFDKRRFVAPSGYSIQSNSDIGIQNLFELSKDGTHLYIGPRDFETNIDLGKCTFNDLTITGGYGAISTENIRKDLISLNLDDKIQIGDDKSGVVLVQGSNQCITIKRESVCGNNEWSEYRIVDEGIMCDFMTLNKSTIFTYGTTDPDNDDGFPDGHIYIKI